MTGSPLFRDTFALCGVVLEEVELEAGFQDVRRRLGRGALRLLDDVTLAFAGFERQERLADADAELATLRVQLRLAYELEVLDEEMFLALAEQADRIGRQLGGWLKKLCRSGP
jgi:23S rRNA-intervening sequence protein